MKCEVCGTEDDVDEYGGWGASVRVPLCCEHGRSWQDYDGAGPEAYLTWLAAEKAKHTPQPEWTDGLTALAGIARGETWECNGYPELTFRREKLRGILDSSGQAALAETFAQDAYRWRRVAAHVHEWRYLGPDVKAGQERKCSTCPAKQVAEWRDV